MAAWGGFYTDEHPVKAKAEARQSGYAERRESSKIPRDELDRTVAQDLENTLLRALEFGVQKAAECFAKGAPSGSRHLRITESEAAKIKAAGSWGCSVHVGFYSNCQVIGNLLHLIVQLALFPRPDTAEVGLQGGSRSVRVEEREVQACQEERPRSEMGVQSTTVTNPPPQVLSKAAAPALGKESVRVRIGGGFQVMKRSAGDHQESHDEHGMPTLKSVLASVCERGKAARRRQDGSEQHLHSHDAPSRCTGKSRYAVGAYATGSQYGESHVSGDPLRLATKAETGSLNYFGLYRVLKPHAPRSSPLQSQSARKLSRRSFAEGTPQWQQAQRPAVRQARQELELKARQQVQQQRGLLRAQLQEKYEEQLQQQQQQQSDLQQIEEQQSDLHQHQWELQQEDELLQNLELQQPDMQRQERHELHEQQGKHYMQLQQNLLAGHLQQRCEDQDVQLEVHEEDSPDEEIVSPNFGRQDLEHENFVQQPRKPMRPSSARSARDRNRFSGQPFPGPFDRGPRRQRPYSARSARDRTPIYPTWLEESEEDVAEAEMEPQLLMSEQVFTGFGLAPEEYASEVLSTPQEELGFVFDDDDEHAQSSSWMSEKSVAPW